MSDVVPVPPASNADLMPKSSLDVEVNVPVPTVRVANSPPTRVMQVSKMKRLVRLFCGVVGA